MKTLRNLFVLFISILLIVPTGTAYAATTDEHHEVDVCVNNEWVDASVYVDENNVAWVANYSQLYLIFPEETNGFNFPAVQEPSSLKNWAIRFNYNLKVTPNVVYLFREDTDPNIPESLKLYVNNIRVYDVNVYRQNDIIWLGSYSDVFKVFPEETKDLSLPAVQEPTRLKSWANDFDYKMDVNEFGVYLSKEVSIPENPENPGNVIPEQPDVPVVTPENPDTPNITIPENVKLYVNGMYVSNVTDTASIKKWANNSGYTYVEKGSRIYLSNTGVTPIEVYLNSEIIDFPDQQPLILNNRTMIPIRAVSESLGWNVSWGENVVTITNDSHVLILYIGKDYYTIDSVRKTMDVPAQIMNNRTMVPIRFVAEAFGYSVGYNGSGSVKLVTIDK